MNIADRELSKTTDIRAIKDIEHIRATKTINATRTNNHIKQQSYRNPKTTGVTF